MNEQVKGEREFEIGKDESWFANIKRTYDEYQDLSLTQARDSHAYIQKVLGDAQQYDNQRQAIANQSLQNAVETANMVSKQAVRHADLATDRHWNIDEVAHLVAKTPVFQDAIAAAVAGAIASSLEKKG